MNLGDIKRRVKNTFGDTAQVQLTDGMIVDWANDAQMDIARKTECLAASVSGPLSVSITNFPLPANFLRENRVELATIGVLRRTTLEALDKSISDLTVAGIPELYYLVGNYMNFYPMPNIDLTLNIFFLAVPSAELAGDTDVPEIPIRFHEDIVRYTLAEAKKMDEEYAEAGALMQEYDARIAQTKYDTSETADSYPAIRVLPGDYGDMW